MEGYTIGTYGAAFADVYDRWYGDLTDRQAFTAMVYGLALADLPVLELGIGTGRLAAPIAQAGLDVVGIDASAAMLARIPTVTGGRLRTVHGDMVDDLPDGPFGLAFCGFNTFFNLLTEARQQACLTAVARRLAPGAAFIVEAAIPSAGDAGDDVRVRSMTATEVVLSVSRHDPDAQLAEGQYISITEAGGIRLRPWSIRWCTPAQLDEMAAIAGLALVGRYADYARSPLSTGDGHHVSVYRQPTDYPPVRPSAAQSVLG